MTFTKESVPTSIGMATGAQGVTMPRNSDGIVPDQKHFATLQAEYARVGHELHQLADGSFYSCRWGQSKHLPDMQHVSAFLARIGGSHE
jgi:hypothetical protein